jgi:tetratricopeptide (TPR) repeat protein
LNLQGGVVRLSGCHPHRTVSDYDRAKRAKSRANREQGDGSDPPAPDGRCRGFPQERDLLGLLVDHAGQRGDLLRQGGDVAGALADYESALVIAPNFLEGWMHRGALLTETGRGTDALASYDRAQALAPQSGDVWYNRGVALQDMGRDADALEAYGQSVKFAPDFPDAWNNRGALLRKMGKTDEALASFARALKLNPAHPQALTNKAEVEAALSPAPGDVKH